MQSDRLLTALFVAISVSAGAQQSAVSAPLPKPEQVKLYTAAPKVTKASPLVFDFGNSLAEKCGGLVKAANVRFSLVVDASGRPRNVIFDKPLGNDIDLLALKVMLMTHFHPATLNGSPVAVGQFLDMRLEICIETAKSAAGQDVSNVRLRFAPEEILSDWDRPADEANLAPIEMPTSVFADGEHINALFSEPRAIARPKIPPELLKFGTFKFRLLVDEHGIPRDRVALECTDPKRLPQIANLMQEIRYVPAMKDGMPLPAHITEELAFRSQ